MAAKRIIIIGVTGSIGSQAVDVILSQPQAFRAVAVAARSSQAKCVQYARALGARAYVGEDAALAAIAENEADVCLVAALGPAAYAATVAAIGKGMDVALASKEVLVAGGRQVMEKARAQGVRIIPVDSEHSAIFQCLGAAAAPVARLTLTASGGPFLDGPADLDAVTPAMALKHPTWRMGRKVTVDSATLMNKGFEIIEAHYLFGVDPDRIEVVIHPESVVHSLVTFEDGATLAQLSPPDMRLAIQYALSAPARLSAHRATLDLAALGALTFRRPDENRFPTLGYARQALRLGEAALAALVAADEAAVEDFLALRIPFTGIFRQLAQSLDHRS